MIRALPHLVGLVSIVLVLPVGAGGQEVPIVRLGMIGLDTSHVIAFTKYLNDPKNNTGCKVIVAFPGGSPDFPPSATRVKNFTEQLHKECGVEIVGSIEDLCSKVDGVLLESVDGRPHLQQVRPVLAARKPVFIDKPMAASVADVIEIFRLAREAGVPCWSSSDCRFSPGVIEARKGKVGDVVGCLSYGPSNPAPHHPDLYWYGVHWVETLFAIMGPGCVSVTRTTSDGADVVVGLWKDGRIGIFRGAKKGTNEEGYVVFGSKGVFKGGHEEYHGLLKQMVEFFKTGKVPVPPEETIETFAFMSAADESKAKGGVPVTLESVIRKARGQSASAK
jgi:predicted dehydrogenase